MQIINRQISSRSLRDKICSNSLIKGSLCFLSKSQLQQLKVPRQIRHRSLNHNKIITMSSTNFYQDCLKISISIIFQENSWSCCWELSRTTIRENKMSNILLDSKKKERKNSKKLIRSFHRATVACSIKFNSLSSNLSNILSRLSLSKLCQIFHRSKPLLLEAILMFKILFTLNYRTNKFKSKTKNQWMLRKEHNHMKQIRQNQLVRSLKIHKSLIQLMRSKLILLKMNEILFKMFSLISC